MEQERDGSQEVDVTPSRARPPSAREVSDENPAGLEDAGRDRDVHDVPDDAITTLGDVPVDLFAEPADPAPIARDEPLLDHDDAISMVQSLFPGRMVALEPFPSGNPEETGSGEPAANDDNDASPPEATDLLG